MTDTNASAGSYPEQDEWLRLCREHGADVVRNALVAKLRAAADCIENANGLDGDVFGCEIDNIHPQLFRDTFIEHISITVSLPWPG